MINQEILDGENIMEQQKLPFIISVMALFLFAGFSIKGINSEYFSFPQILSDFHEWMAWKLMPGW